MNKLRRKSSSFKIRGITMYNIECVGGGSNGICNCME